MSGGVNSGPSSALFYVWSGKVALGDRDTHSDQKTATVDFLIEQVLTRQLLNKGAVRDRQKAVDPIASSARDTGACASQGARVFSD